MAFGDKWENHLAYAKFAYNSRYYLSIEMIPFEVIYGRRCRSLVGWFNTSEVRLRGMT